MKDTYSVDFFQAWNCNPEQYDFALYINCPDKPIAVNAVYFDMTSKGVEISIVNTNKVFIERVGYKKVCSFPFLLKVASLFDKEQAKVVLAKQVLVPIKEMVKRTYPELLI